MTRTSIHFCFCSLRSNMKFSILLIPLLASLTIQAPVVDFSWSEDESELLPVQPSNVPHTIEIQYCTMCPSYIKKARELIDMLPVEFPDEKFVVNLTPLRGKNQIIIGEILMITKQLQASLMSFLQKLEHQKQLNCGQFQMIAGRNFHL